MNSHHRRQDEKSGKALISRNPEIAKAVRDTTLREADPQTETQRLIAVAFFDLQEGKITKKRFDELTGHLLIEPVTSDQIPLSQRHPTSVVGNKKIRMNNKIKPQGW